MNDSVKDIGGKASALRSLVSEGFSVPSFFSIPADLLDEAAAVGLDGFRTLLAKLMCDHADFFVERSLYAVRSSADIEDNLEFSMAGIYHSHIDVTLGQLAESMYDCWQAGHHPDVKTYLAFNGASSARLHLIIQKMVKEQTHAAIAFTANPDGLLNERVLVIGEGRGAALVSDEAPSLTYYRHASEQRAYYENPHGLALMPQALLTTIWDLLERIEVVFGPALDLELAIDRDWHVHVLQMRPITTLQRDRLKQPGTILDNSNIIESYPGLTLPLSTDFYHQAYEGVFAGLMKRLLPRRRPAVDVRLSEIARNMVASWNGRAYYRLQNWLGLLAHLPFQQRIIPSWMNMMGVNEAGIERPKAMLPWWQRGGIGLRFAWNIHRLDANYERLKAAVETIEAEFIDLQGRDGPAILYEVFYHRIREQLLMHWDITLINDLVAMIAVGRLKKLSAAGLNEDANALISGFTALESMKPVESLLALNEHIDGLPTDVLTIAAHDSTVARMVVNGEHPSFQGAEARTWLELVREHIRLYGDRSIEELKLESPTQRTNPELLFRLLISMSNTGADTDGAEQHDQHRTAERSPAGIEADSDQAEKRPPKEQKVLSRARLAIARREESRLLRTRVYGIVRQIFRILGTRLVMAGAIDELVDVFWLTTDEVFQAAADTRSQPVSLERPEQEEHTSESTELRKLIKKRKHDYMIWASIPPYSRLIFESEAFSKHRIGSGQSKNDIEQDRYQGVGSSSGIFEGEAVIVSDIRSAHDIKGKILVCHNTDPGWVYLIMQAGAIVAEQGSILSHTAIIARELGVPAVVGITHATQVFRDGERLHIDGRSGLVTRLGAYEPMPEDQLAEPTHPADPTPPTQTETINSEVSP